MAAGLIVDAGLGAAGPGDRACRRRGGGRTRAPSGSGRRCGCTGTARPGVPSSRWPSTLASAVRRCRANRSASSGRKLGTVLPVRRTGRRRSAGTARWSRRRRCRRTRAVQVGGGGAQGELLVDGQVGVAVAGEFGHGGAPGAVGRLGRRAGASRSMRSADRRRRPPRTRRRCRPAPGRGSTSAAAALLGGQVFVGVVADRDDAGRPSHNVVQVRRAPVDGVQAVAAGDRQCTGMDSCRPGGCLRRWPGPGCAGSTSPRRAVSGPSSGCTRTPPACAASSAGVTIAASASGWSRT